ncbi:MAG TPA: membrane protein insertion efficiency factor YidD [Limnochordales bacterium]
MGNNSDNRPGNIVQVLLIGLIRLYRRVVSPLFPPRCRFYPSCSEYAEQAVRRYGVLRGGWMAVVRLSKCHPFHPGGYDPVR